MIETEAETGRRDRPDGSRFRRHSIFEQATAEVLTLTPGPNTATDEPGWLEDARSEITERGWYVAFSDGGDQHLEPLGDGWTRIGRSAAADIRLDDATVSRRHALIVNSEDEGLRVLDDRSMNGISLNGERIEWSVLDDGDELQVGRYRLFVIDADRSAAGA